ncbi:MAG: hypothetical protein M3Y56_00455 [Armatimonadota bacterium]|nr:hypothetical protein [Armatimonadota bacterium]
MAISVEEKEQTRSFRAGDVVQVRDWAEICASLDPKDALDNLPFMPEMKPFCGRTFRVARRADRVCVEGTSNMGRMDGAVFLEDIRCDGAAHEGCQRGCLLIWKEKWLKPGLLDNLNQSSGISAVTPEASGLITIQDDRFYCQSTELKKATTRLPWWEGRQYLRDVASGNLTVWQMVCTLANFLERKTIGKVLSTVRARQRRNGGRTPTATLNLQPGEWVVIKSEKDIQATLDGRGCNRGLEFSPGMSFHCGGRYRVLQRLDKMIVEGAGKMRNISNTVILEGVACSGACSRGCPRANYMYWREVWLQRAE